MDPAFAGVPKLDDPRRRQRPIDIRRIERSSASATAFSTASLPRSSAAAATARHRIASYARRFAAKEAAAKALGTGFRRGVFWRDLGVVNLPPGSRDAADRRRVAALEAITPPGWRRGSVSLTDEPPLAQAVVIISALPAVAAGG